VTINDSNKNFTVKSLLITLISCIFFCLISNIGCYAQDKKNEIELSFSKSNDSIKSVDLYFNVLKVWNNTTKPITGNLSFNGPENWKIITFPTEKTTINPGDTTFIPIRVSPIYNAVGGIAYIITATFRTSSHIVSANSYLALPQNSKWDFSTTNSSLYFTETKPNTSFNVNLVNRGNSNELIKLQLQAGKLLSFKDKTTNSFVEYIDLPAFKDTVITHLVTFKENLNYIDKLKYENNWKESSVSVTASTDTKSKSAAVQIQKLNSIYYNQRLQNSSPLNFDYQLYNLMSNQELRNNFRMFGTVLFPHNREIQYLAGLQNVYFNGDNSKIDFNRQFIYSLNYNDNLNSIYLGYNVSGGMLHSVNGRGIVGTLKLGNVTRVTYTLTQNPYNNVLGGVLGLSTSIKGISFNTEVVHETQVNGNYKASSVLFGTGFSLFQHHTFSLQVLGSQANYKDFNTQNPDKDTAVVGYSYRADYSVRYKKLDMRLSALDSRHNYISNAGLQQFYLDGKYTFSNKVMLSIYGNRQLYATTSYPYNFYIPVNFNSSDYLRLATSISVGSVVFQVGPNYNGSMRQTINSLTGYKSTYNTYQPGIWASTMFKLGGYRSITPNITVSNIRFYYKTDEPGGLNYSSDKNIFYTAGLNYFDNIWRVNAYYSSGSISDLYRAVQVETTPTASRSIQVRPAFENYFFNRTVKLSAYMNYAYYMPSGRENTSYNIRYDHYLKGGWNFSVSGYMYSNTRVDDEQGRVTTKDLNFVLGLSKSINIQQPRQKYYNFKTVFFDDLDGNRLKSDNEPPVSNILVNVQKDRAVSTGKSSIPEIKLISDVSGSISIINLPKDSYKLTFDPLQNLQSLYFLDGSEQSYFNDKERTLYVPLAESYKIKGKIILVRDPNSTEGKIDLSGVRIIAIGDKGETFSTLSDNTGTFILSVPNANKYKVHINNVFGEHFYIESNEIEVQFSQNKTISIDFTFIENKRGIQFENGGELFKFSSLGNQDESAPVASQDVNQDEAVPKDGAETYAIELASSKTYRKPSAIKNKYKLKGDVLYTEQDGVYKYYTGNYATQKEAKAAMTKLGIAGNAVAVDRSLLKAAAVGAVAGQLAAKATKSGRKIRSSVANQPDNNEQVLATNLPAGVQSGAGVAPAVIGGAAGFVAGQLVSNTSTKAAGNVQNQGSTSTEKIEAAPVKTAPTATIPTSSIASPTKTNLAPSVIGGAASGFVAGQLGSNTSTKADGSVQNQVATPTDKVDAVPVKVTQAPSAKNQPSSIASPAKVNLAPAAIGSAAAGFIAGQLGSGSNEDKVQVGEKTDKNAGIPAKDEATNVQPEADTSLQSQAIVPLSNVPVAAKIAAPKKVAKPKIASANKQAAKEQTISDMPVSAVSEQQYQSSKDTYLYAICLDASNDYHDINYYREKFRLPFEVKCIAKDGVRKYYTGKYKSVEEATADIARYGLTGFIVPIADSVDPNPVTVQK